MPKRTTIEIDEELLARAKRALGGRTARATVQEALLRVAVAAEDEQACRAEAQRDYFKGLCDLADLHVLASDDMWR